MGSLRNTGAASALRASPGRARSFGWRCPCQRGRALAGELVAQDAAATPERLAALREIRQLVTATGFAELLELIYDRYPDYAVRSVFR